MIPLHEHKCFPLHESSEDNFKLQLEAPIEEYAACNKERALESALSTDKTMKHQSYLLLES